MRSIANDFDVVCGAYFPRRRHDAPARAAASGNHVGDPVALGTRMLLSTLQAAVYFARAPKDAAAWLERTMPDNASERAEALDAGMTFVREQGYLALVSRSGADFAALGISHNLRSALDDPPVLPLLAINDTDCYAIAAIMAPIYDACGKVTMALLMAGFHDAQTGAAIRQAGARLSAACAHVSGFLSGRLVAVAD